MKIRAILLSILILCGTWVAFLYSQASRPQPDTPRTQTIKIKEEHAPLVIKRLILQLKEELEVDNDRFPEQIKQIDTYTRTCTDSAAVAILHSMLAEMYQNYYRKNQRDIDGRTQLSGYIPEDIREWTSNLFTDKIKEELGYSLQPASLLKATPIDSFLEILEEGTDSKTLRPTLYEFLAFRALDIQPSSQIYQEVIEFQEKESNKQALLLTKLDYLRFRYGGKKDQETYDTYMTALDGLYQEVSSQPYAAEIGIAKMELMRQTAYLLHSGRQDSIQAEEVNLCEETIKRYPDYPRTSILRNRLAELKRPALSISTDNTVYPGKEAKIRLTYKNIREISIQIYRVSKTPEEVAVYSYMNYSGHNDKPSGKLVVNDTYLLALPNAYSQQDTTLSLQLDQPGQYECIVTADGQDLEVATPISVSRLAAIYRTLPGNQRQIMVTDYLSGEPIEGATVTYYEGNRRNFKEQGYLKTDSEGWVTLPTDKRIIAFQASLPNDRNGRLTQVYPRGTSRTSDKKNMEIALYTDRGLYRPGQTVYFKGIAYVKETDDPYTVANQSISVSFYDTQGKEIAKQSFTTNDFGSFHGKFTIPQQVLNGTFRLNAERANTYIQVEEYKRPTFQTYFLPITEAFAFGDSVKIEGKATTFSGIPLPEGTVNWRITRRSFVLRGSFRPNSSAQVSEGSTSLDKEGKFHITFLPQPDPNNGFSSYQTYEISATLTDSKGETQETSTSFSIGESSLILLCDLPQRVEKESAETIIEATNLNGEEITTSGIFRIMKLIEPRTDKKNEEPLCKEGEQVANGNFTSGQAIKLNSFKSLPSGRYRMSIEAQDQQGRTCTNQTDFILYSREDKRPPVFSHMWLLEEKTECRPGEEAKIIFGTSDKDIYLLYEWFKGNERIHHEQIRLSEANQLFTIPFKLEYEDGIVASFTFVKEGQLHTVQVPIRHQLPNRELTIKPITFRDRLSPGGKETWKFRITDADSMNVSAEVLAGLYDASLDKLLPFHWSFHPERHIRLQVPSFKAGTGFSRTHPSKSADILMEEEPEYQYNALDWLGLFTKRSQKRGSGRTHSALTNEILLMRSTTASPTIEMESDLSIEESTVEETPTYGINPSLRPGQIRQDFAETAFFYPTLQTDPQGDLFISFTLPESNTTWKLQLLANTQDLKYGLWTKEVISSKPLMVLPNLPRFVRQGDQVNIHAQLINSSKDIQSGYASIELFDPITDKPITCLTKAQRPFNLLPDSTATVSWTIQIPTSIEVMGIRILANSEGASDGEQGVLPVLSNQLLITESTPFYLSEEDERQIKVAADTLTEKIPFRLTLEVSANPIWYAVQALPTITQPNDDNILSWFASYYSNTLATYIALSNPHIREAIDLWTAENENTSTLSSNLEKNQELKDILLEETPWVLEAKDETEQKRRLSLLFDLNRSENLKETAMRKLIQEQEEEGGWSWIKGFPTSRSITLSILKGMSQLTRLNAIQYGQEEKEMQIKALQFLDKKIQVDYERLTEQKTNRENTLPTAEQVEYLFVRSFFRDIPEAGDAKEAIRFYTNLAEKHWKEYDLRSKGEIALLMYKNGIKDVATDILNWLKKTATTSEEKGMYWANNRREADHFHSPIETHCLLMSAFAEIEPDSTRMDQMKQWLLTQKRTQDWESTPATVNAIYALLLTGKDWLGTPNTCEINWEGNTYRTNEGEAVIGYLKTELPQAKSDTEKVLAIHKEGNAPAWGALYEQYFQPINEVKGQKGVLNVEKKLFVEINNGTDIQMRPVTVDQALQVGDKVIVRLILRTDREMNYVFLKDTRAGCFEPMKQVSGMERKDGLWYYHSPKDVSENFFFEHLPEGTFVLEYTVYVSRSGEYAGGISTIQCLYAPEFVSHTAGETLKVTP